MESVIVVLQVRVVATQTYPKTTVTTRATGRTLQRNIKSARPASSDTLRTYTTGRDATPGQVDRKMLPARSVAPRDSNWQGWEKSLKAQQALVKNRSGDRANSASIQQRNGKSELIAPWGSREA
ncbi:MAG: hypothetical protein ABS49_04835 [Erythrobacter sp. SCN 62-14]|nr:MAG: hypothetical protein ABS49_04835 [Erythrobacter sp. SCN 62-14]